MQLQATKTAVITGATQGIGRHTALRLAAAGGHRVLLHGRTRPQAETALRELRAEAGAAAGGLVGCVHGDLADLAQVRGVADQVRAALGEGALDVLINNAGVFANGPRRVSADGFELTHAVNVLAPFVLTHELLPQMAERGRVVTTASLSAAGSVPWDDLQLERNYSDHRAYSLSKLLDILFTFALHRRRGELGVPTLQAVSLDPGTVNTRMLRQGWSMAGIDLNDANDTWKVATQAGEDSGVYYVGGSPYRPPAVALDVGAQDRLWETLAGQAKGVLSS